MYAEVNIGTKKVPMLALASIDNYYMQIFGEDPVRIQETADGNVALILETMKRMGFVMAKYAELQDRKAMFKLNMDNYFEWLDNFERTDIYEAIGDIRAVYEGQKMTSAVEKKEEDQ